MRKNDFKVEKVNGTVFGRIKANKLSDIFKTLESRNVQGIYFCRINGYNNEVAEFIRKYYETAVKEGVVIEGGIPNPDEKGIMYYNETMGTRFFMDKVFIVESLKRWLPRMNQNQRDSVGSAIYNELDGMRKKGKNDNILKNAYIKIMCGLYYKFERITNKLGMSNVPKILYEGYVNNYELMLLSVLANAGCDVVLLQYNGDAQYLKTDKNGEKSDNYMGVGLKPFPQGFSLKSVRDEIQKNVNRQRLYGTKPDIENCTNAWIDGKGLADVLTPVERRGTDGRFFYNCFVRISGVEDKTYYVNELFQFYTQFKESKRNLVIVDDEIPKPSPDEVARVNKGNYNTVDSMLMDLAKNFNKFPNVRLQKIIVKSFMDTMLSLESEANINKMKNKAVFLICWLNRYFSQLFSNSKITNVACFIYMGGCKDDNEALFLKFLARLPVDVLILRPNLSRECCLKDNLLYDIHFDSSLNMDKFPTDNTAIRVGTAAYHAERELDTLMYQDSGMYRDRQYNKAVSLTLETMYEEIDILWKEELKYRPNFSTMGDTVTMPVIFAKICGVKDNNVDSYWVTIKRLITEECYIVSNVPFINPRGENPMRVVATECLRNGKLQRQKIKAHPNYQYGFLQPETQDYILDKLQMLIDNNVIKGTFENGMEYNIVAVVLNMRRELLRLIQNFDFTKKNPKLIYLHMNENSVTIEDAILAAFLNLLGFDVVFFVPTGYQCVEQYYKKPILSEHQCGEYRYDLRLPDFRKISTKEHIPWHKRLFKRG